MTPATIQIIQVVANGSQRFRFSESWGRARLQAAARNPAHTPVAMTALNQSKTLRIGWEYYLRMRTIACTLKPMYNPAPFAEDRIDILHALIGRHPLAAVVTCGASGPEATHVPVVLHTGIGPQGVLRCHVARANPHWKSIEIAASVLAIFQGPQHYITPSWYPSKQQHGKVVPTWNYLAVHVRGRARLFEEQALLVEHLHELTAQNEAGFETPWSVSDAPADYVGALSKAIVGIEISIDSIEGKWKVSQNRPEADRHGVAAGLTSIHSPASLEMAELVKERGLK
jgi:transcriptional regulator